jgi:hypothetical protein
MSRRNQELEKGRMIEQVHECLKDLETNPLTGLLLPENSPPWLILLWSDIFRELVPAAHKKDAYSLQGIASILGALTPIRDLANGDLPMPDGYVAKAKAEDAKLKELAEKAFKLLPADRLDELHDAFEKVFKAIESGDELVKKLVKKQPVADQAEFHIAYGKGLKFDGDRYWTRIQDPMCQIKCALVLTWPKVEKFQTRRALYDWLQSRIPETSGIEFSTFEKMCKDKGLKLSSRGRPRKRAHSKK